MNHMFLDYIGECSLLRHILVTRRFGSWLHCFRQVESHYTDRMILLTPSDDRTENLVREVRVPSLVEETSSSQEELLQGSIEHC